MSQDEAMSRSEEVVVFLFLFESISQLIIANFKILSEDIFGLPNEFCQVVIWLIS